MSETLPGGGDLVEFGSGKMRTPDHPLIAFIEGDGIGRDIWPATKAVTEAAVERAYEGRRKIVWVEVLAGEKAKERTGSYLPPATLDTLRQVKVGIKGPLTTPVGGGIRSLNVALRQELDLYACVRPVRYYPGVSSPLQHPEQVDMVIYRENTEDVYAGIEWPSGSAEAALLVATLKERLGVSIDPLSGIGIKPISPGASKRLVRRAITYAIEAHRRSVTLVHKGNIQKFTEGAFRDWGYEVASEFKGQVVLEQDLSGPPPEGLVVIKDRIADNMFQQVLLHPGAYDVIATTNLNGDYLSDAIAAEVGGIGLAPGANLSDQAAVFEATHGTAPRHAGKDEANPGSLMLSAAMMLEAMGWTEAAKMLEGALAQSIADGIVTYDLVRPGATKVSTSEFARSMMSRMQNKGVS